MALPEGIELEHMLQSIQGWCSPAKAQKLMAGVMSLKAKTIIEVGVFGASSFTVMLLALRERGEGHAYGIDPWARDASLDGMIEDVHREWWSNIDYEEIYRGCQEQIGSRGLWPYCTLLRMKATDAVGTFKDDSVDLLHLDGNHSEDMAYADATLYYPKVRSGGMIVFDDIWWSEGGRITTRKAVTWLMERCDVIETVNDCLFLTKK